MFLYAMWAENEERKVSVLSLIFIRIKTLPNLGFRKLTM